MDGDQAYSVHLVTLDGIARKCVVPFFDEIVYIRRMIAQVFIQRIIESTDIRTLPFESVKVEKSVYLIDKVNERHP